jgi:UBX domain-containing protein 1
MSDDSNNTTAGGRSLGGGASEPLPTNWLHPTERPRVGRIGDSGGHHDDDDEDEDENQERESWFAGGERRYQRMTSLSKFKLIRCSLFSGLSIENPDRQRAVPGGNMVRDLLRRAAQ